MARFIRLDTPFTILSGWADRTCRYRRCTVHLNRRSDALSYNQQLRVPAMNRVAAPYHKRAEA